MPRLSLKAINKLCCIHSSILASLQSIFLTAMRVVIFKHRSDLALTLFKISQCLLLIQWIHLNPLSYPMRALVICLLPIYLISTTIPNPCSLCSSHMGFLPVFSLAVALRLLPLHRMFLLHLFMWLGPLNIKISTQNLISRLRKAFSNYLN